MLKNLFITNNMIHNILLLTTFIYIFTQKPYTKEFIFMPTFDKYCGYKPSIDALMESIENSKLCIDGYYPHTIIVNKAYNMHYSNDKSKEYCTYHIICSKNKIRKPELISRL